MSHISESAQASHILDTDVDKLGWKQIVFQSSAPFRMGTSKQPGLRVEPWCGVLKSNPECLTWQWIWCKLQPEARGREVRGIVMWDNRVNSECWSLLPLWPTFQLRRQGPEQRIQDASVVISQIFLFSQLRLANIDFLKFACYFFFGQIRRVLPQKDFLNVPWSIRDNFILSFDSRNFSPRGAGVYYRCDCMFKEPWVSDVWISSFPAAQPASSKLHDGWWAYKDLVQGSFIPGKPFKKEKKTVWEYAECVLSRVMLLAHTIRLARYAEALCVDI